VVGLGWVGYMVGWSVVNSMLAFECYPGDIKIQPIISLVSKNMAVYHTVACLDT